MSVNPTVALGGVAMFLGGAAAALLASYPIPGNSIFVCFVALFVALAAALIGGAALALHAINQHAANAEKHQVRVDRVVEATVDRLLKRRGLELVDRD